MEVLLNNQDKFLKRFTFKEDFFRLIYARSLTFFPAFLNFSCSFLYFLLSLSLNIYPNCECTTLKANNQNKMFIQYLFKS